jgi:hypothetical protein
VLQPWDLIVLILFPVEVVTVRHKVLAYFLGPLPEHEIVGLVVGVLRGGWEERRATTLADIAIALASHAPCSCAGVLFLVGVCLIPSNSMLL